MSFSAIEKILEDATGLDSSSIGANVVHRVVKLRMEVAGVSDVNIYHDRLKKDKQELQALIEDVTVPETWFFRDKEPFELLTQLVRSEWLPPSPERVLRILSIPCATGEEAYSIAMIMRSLGFTTDTVRIDAVDISKRVLERAMNAEYKENSFRGDEGNYLRKFFDKNGALYRLHDSVRGMVKFWHGNLLDDKFLPGSELYDIVFCRNVMIYFTRELQEKAIKKLHRLLAVDGLLFVGHAEAANLSGNYFASIRRAGTFAFRKKMPGEKKDDEAPRRDLKLVSATEKPSSFNGKVSNSSSKDAKKARRFSKPRMVVDAEPSAKIQATDESILKKIQRMADEGQLREAASLCEKSLQNDAGNAELYYLLGLIREAEQKDADAGNLFRKTVYLDPRHYEALVHLAILAESQGNLAAAAVYRARASRLSKEDV